MEFWGVEVQSGKPLKVTPEEDYLVHISQASLGECKSKKGESVPLYVKVGEQKLVLGTLSSESIPQISFDLVFEKEFELSHNGKGSVFFVGYKSPNIDDQEGGEYFSDSEEEEEEEEVPATITANGNAVAKPKATTVQVKKNAKPDNDASEEGMDVDEDDSDDDEEEEETPNKPESNKKRANEAAPKTPVSAKKAKAAATPQKAEEKKKDEQTAKKGGKTPTTATQSPKSASQVSCGSCKKTFNSGNALESHNKAKHAAAAK